MISIITENLTKWAQEKICNEIKLKLPSARGGIDYEYELVNPTAFPFFCPPQDKLQGAPRAPSVTIQIENCTDNLSSESKINVSFVFVVWNTGEHDKRQGKENFTKTLDGAKDLWRFMDKARHAVRQNFSLAGYEVISDITGRPLVADSAIMGTYPYFFGEIKFTIGTIDSVYNMSKIKEML